MATQVKVFESKISENYSSARAKLEDCNRRIALMQIELDALLEEKDTAEKLMAEIVLRYKTIIEPKEVEAGEL